MTTTTPPAFAPVTPPQIAKPLPCSHPYGFVRLVPVTDTAANVGPLRSAVACSRCGGLLYLDSGVLT